MRLVFDRGTLMLLDPPRGWRASVVPGALWDPRVGALRCPAHLLDAVKEALGKEGVQFSDEVAGERLPRPEFGTAIELRPYQRAALTAWDLAGRRGMVVLPTGAGKTRVALAAVAEAAVPSLCLVPTRVLLEQWCRAVRDLTGCAPGIHGDGERTIAPITIATFESAWRHADRIGNRFGMLIVDEAHHFGGSIRDEALEMCTASFRLGLSATPPGGAAAERLAALLGPTVYELSVRDLAGSFLAPFDDVVIHVDLDPAERAEHAARVDLDRRTPRGARPDFSRARRAEPVQARRSPGRRVCPLRPAAGRSNSKWRDR